METWFVWLARLMYLGIILIAGGMGYRAWRIAARNDLRHVADWRGTTLVSPARWAKPVAAVNITVGGLLLAIASSVLLIGLPFHVWTGVAALVLWSYYFLLRLIVNAARRQGGAQP